MATWRSAVATHVIDPLGWKIKGTPLGARFAEFRRLQWDERETWLRRREMLLSRLLAHAIERVPFYASRVTGLTRESIEAAPLESLKRFPVLERADLVERFDELKCEMGRGTSMGRSGGSTGTPVRFLHDKIYSTAAFATTQLSLDWAGIARGDRRVALWGARRDFAGRAAIVRRVNLFFRDVAILDAFRMGDAEMRAYVDFVNRRPPACLEGYTEALFALAEFVEREGLEIASPRAVGTGAGTLFPHMREKLGRVLRAPVFDRYGTREAGLIATECERHSGLHLMGETTVLEIIDRDGADVGVGQAGEAVATNLWNYTMPLIRYRVGDHVVRGQDDCGCGRPYPLIERVVGRAAASFERPDGGSVLPDFWIRLLAVDFNTGDVEKYQFVQESLDRITVRLVMRSGHEPPGDRTRKAIAARIRDAMGAPTEVAFSVENDIAPTESGKHLYSVSKV